jgi:CRISPR/Cas system-associated protein Cas10 (large subunit of type III CRISPR-Cas system)
VEEKMDNLKLLRSIYDEILNKLRKKGVLADTRVETVSLYDHLVLTAGIAVATVRELLARGKTPEDICGENIPEDKLVLIIRVAALLHDWGKDHEELYKNHIKRSIEQAKSWLEKYGVEQIYLNLILSAIERHHSDSNPRTLLEKIVCIADTLASAGDRPELARASTTDELTRISESSYNLYQVVFGGKDGLVLILGDVDKVKSYVYETTKLPEIRGASQLLNDLNYEKLEELFEKRLSKECLIYNGGGSFLAISPESLADDLINEVKNTYLLETKTATITCVKSNPLGFFEFFRGLMPYDNKGIRELKGSGIGLWLLKSHYGKFSMQNKDEWFEKRKINSEEIEICKRKGFGELISKLSAELRKEKDQKEYIPFFEAIPIGRRCQSCGKRVATQVDIITPEESEDICEICYIKRCRGRGERLRFLEAFINWIKINKNPNFKEILALKIPKHLDELVSLNGYWAFIYADGNDIGSLLEKAKSPSSYRHISESLQEGTKNSLFEAIYETFRKKLIEDEKLHFEIINIGGDDISIIIAAPFAFDFSAKFMEFFEKNLEKLGKEFGKKITISLGIAICKSTYPVYFAEKIADSLLKDAKSKYKELPEDEKESTLSYLYLTSSIAAESSREIIKNVYENEKRILTLRPYTRSQFKFLLNKSFELKKLLKASQRNKLMEALSKGKLQSINFLFYQIARMQNKREEALRILEEINKEFNANGGWTTVDGKDATPLLDLLEFIKIRGDIDG